MSSMNTLMFVTPMCCVACVGGPKVQQITHSLFQHVPVFLAKHGAQDTVVLEALKERSVAPPDQLGVNIPQVLRIRCAGLPGCVDALRQGCWPSQDVVLD